MTPSHSTRSNSSSSESGACSQAPNILSPIDSVSTFSPPSSDSSPNSEPLAKSFSTSPYKSESEALAFVIRTLEAWNPEVEKAAEYYFTDVPPAWGPSIFAYLDEEGFPLRKSWNSQDHVLRLKIPTQIHNSIQRWFTRCASEWERSGLITPDERDMIDGEFGTTLSFPHSPFVQSRKEPDILVDPDDGQGFPSVVFEAGWSESWNGLEADCELLLRGSGGLTKAAILVNWTLNRQHRTVSGEASVWTLNDSDQPQRRQIEVIFPSPNFPEAQGLSIIRGELWRGSLDPMRNPQEVLRLDIDMLRQEALRALARMGLGPAL
ncbi:hypothetical protein N7535_001464 [Penicillium sp. DV-2018c]|nr:hypothetical protein N7461_005291 [Penicillium sp. DV-2018c]KAJ5582844.1 hypothetical protein N7535_001464 [Penicillium sp. DV-2018c]